jgi:hypothetical protein
MYGAGATHADKQNIRINVNMGNFSQFLPLTAHGNGSSLTLLVNY